MTPIFEAIERAAGQLEGTLLSMPAPFRGLYLEELVLKPNVPTFDKDGQEDIPLTIIGISVPITYS